MSAVPDFWREARPPAGYFDSFRVYQYPTYYGEDKTPVTSDVTIAGFIFAASILAFSLVLILPGIRNGDRLSTFIRIIISVGVLGSIMVANFGQEWEVATLFTKTQYKAGVKKEINATVGVKIGLRSVNITLKAHPQVQSFDGIRANETINYNERFSWNGRGWLVGNLGFGLYAGRFNQEFREHQRRGSPYPILWVAEYFTIDGEGLRWGRHYQNAGYFAHIFVWAALPLWILSLILFKMVTRYGGYFSLMTGLSLIIANLVWACARNPVPLKIPFEAGVLKFHWGWSFILCAVVGVLCSLIGILVLILDSLLPEKLADFFGVDLAQNLEEFYVDPSQLDDQNDGGWGRRKRSRKPTVLLKSQGGQPGGKAHPRDSEFSSENGDIEMQDPRNSNGSGSTVVQSGFRRKTMFPVKTSQKNQPRPIRRDPPTSVDGPIVQYLS